MDKTKVDIIRLQGMKLPVDRPLDGIQICCPAVGTGFIIRAKMNLEIRLIPVAFERPSIGRKGLCLSGRCV